MAATADMVKKTPVGSSLQGAWSIYDKVKPKK